MEGPAAVVKATGASELKEKKRNLNFTIALDISRETFIQGFLMLSRKHH